MSLMSESNLSDTTNPNICLLRSTAVKKRLGIQARLLRVVEKKHGCVIFWWRRRHRCAVDLRKECALSRQAAFVGTRAACSSDGSSRAGITVVSHARTRRRTRTPSDCRDSVDDPRTRH
jgi:hypothetical protein